MIKVISFKICPFVQRVTAMLEAKNAAYSVEYIQLNNKPQWFLDISPTGQVPVLVTPEGVALFESDAIVEYIDEITAPLQPGLTPEQRAIQRAWCYQASKHYLIQCSAMQSASKSVFDERMKKLDASFERFERTMSVDVFFSGGTIGNVDIALLPLLHRAALVHDHSGHDMLAPYPLLKTLQRTLLATPLPDKSVPSDFQQRFSDFYLSSSTWLGRGADSSEEAGPKAPSAAGGCCG